MNRHITGFVLLPLVLGLSSVCRADSDTYRDGEALPQTVSIGRMPAAPVLDGKLTDWPASTTSLLLGQNSQTGRRFAWGGTKDSSGAVRLAWDETYLYLGAEVVDDHQDQATGPGQVWQGDSLELFFNTYPRQQRVDGFWQEAIVPPLAPGNTLKVTGPQKDFEGVEGTAVAHEGGYTLECRVPWSNLTGFEPKVNSALGFQVYLDDRDGNGRKSQLYWYPSAISFSRPTHTNILLLRELGDTALPKVLAGPNNWCVTDEKTMNVSVVGDYPNGRTATVTKLEGEENVEPVTIDLNSAFNRLSIGQGSVDVGQLDGRYVFAVAVRDGKGQALGTTTFETRFVGGRYATIRRTVADQTKRLDALKEQPALVGEHGTEPWEARLAGLNAWHTRLNAFMNNEARPEAVNEALVIQLLTEADGLEHALTKFEDGSDPYQTCTGSLVRAYKSPLTGEYRPLGLYVPENYDAAKKYPLIVILHSIFADERMLSLLAGNFGKLDCIVVQAPSYRQFDWGGVSAAESWAGLEEVKRLYSIDPDRVYLAGYHIGGRGVWQMAAARPEQWAAIAPIFSGIDTGPSYPASRLYPEYYDQATNVQIPQFKKPEPPAALANALEKALFEQSSLVTRMENVAHLPMRSAYGEDEPNAGAERLAMQARLEGLGAPLPTHYVPGAMHGTPASEFSDPGFYQWLLAQRRPARPDTVRLAVGSLRDNSAYWVSVDQLRSPSDVAHVEAICAGGAIRVKTTGVGALTLAVDSTLAEAGSLLTVDLDGSKLPSITVGIKPASYSFTRKPDGSWRQGAPFPGQKHHGLSGPIDDFQRDRFLFVYGTGGGGATNETLQKQAKKMADWGLGAVFPMKADTEVTPEDLRDASLILLGTPDNNSWLGKMQGQLPLEYLPDGFQLGDQTVVGPGTGACVIWPNPLSPKRYVVLVGAVDASGYAVWDARKAGGDYVLGQAVAVEGKTSFAAVARGWFSNEWKWGKELSFNPQDRDG